MYGAKADECAETAVGPSDHSFATNKSRVALDPLSDKFWMFEDICFGIDDAGYDNLFRC
jgi:hypothetical protein